MRLGYVLRWWPTRSETFVAREVAGLRARGHVVDVVSMGHRPDVDGPDPDAVALPRGLRRAWLDTAPDLLAAAPGGTVRQRLRVAWLASLARRRRWDHVVAHFAGEAAALATSAATVAGLGCGVVAHAVDLFRPHAEVTRVLREARPLLTVCDHHRDWLLREHGAHAAVVRMRPPLDVPRASPGEDAPMRWVCVARDVPKKGLGALVDAVRAGGLGTLRLVSDGVRWGGPGVLAGPLPPPEVGAVLARAHGFVLACRVAPDGDRDGVPVALLEAMAAGLPVVTTAVAGLPEVVDDTVGWLVPPDDPAALRAAMAEAARSPAERARRGAAARARVEAGGGVERQVDDLLAALGAAR